MGKNQSSLFALLAAMLVSSAGLPASACTDFLLRATDNTAVVGRSMEWGLDLQSNLSLYPRGQSKASQTPDGKPGLKWTSKYGYLGLDATGLDIALDGMNEQGLSMGMLWLPGTVYQDVQPDHPENDLSLLDLGHWILGNFRSVDELKTAIAGVRVWSPSLKDWGGQPTAHLALHDSTGKSIVIEFIDGKQKIYDNPVHVLTNAPTFDWHLTNLRNYIRVSASNAQPVEIGGTVLAPPGQGGGFLGIPGDWTPPSRFVRTSAMLSFAKPASNASEGVNLAEHILNAVDIPLGDVRTQHNTMEHSDYTQWIVIKDLTNNVFYFRSYDNLTLRKLDLKKMNFDVSEKTHKITPIASGAPSVDITKP